jgi:hypothetical protein
MEYREVLGRGFEVDVFLTDVFLTVLQRAILLQSGKITAALRGINSPANPLANASGKREVKGASSIFWTVWQ